MRIAIVGPTHPLKGGVSQHTTVMAHRLRAAGHDVELVSWARQYPQRLYPGQQEVSEPDLLAFEPVRRVLAWNRPDRWVREARRLRDRDLVVFVHITPVLAPALRTMLAAVRGGRARTVVVAHNVVPHEPSRADVPLVRSVFDAADAVVVHSAAEAARATEITSTPVRTAELAPFLPETGSAALGPHGETATGAPFRRLLFFGLVRPYKGLDVLVRALAAGPPDVALRIAGEFWGGPDTTLDLARSLGVADRLDVRPGYVPSSEVPALFADVDALVLPYRTATGSQGPWLGFEFGVPVLTTSAGRLAESVRDGVDGLVVPPDDVDALAGALRRLYEPGVAAALRAAVVRVDQDPIWTAYLEAVTGPATAAGPSTGPTSTGDRAPQLAYSEIQYKMLDEEVRRLKAKKILAVLHAQLGRADLAGLVALDVGCSAGFIADELAADGALTIGADIDVPGLRTANDRFGDRVQFVCTSGDDMGFPGDSMDVVVFNHIYEHVVDADAVIDEIHRVLRPEGVAYLALGNRYQLIEPHYRLPLLSWLPQAPADRYVRWFGKADDYYESYRSRRGLIRMLRGFHVWDYTLPVMTQPDAFGSGDQVKGVLRRIPAPVFRAAMPVVPTFIWVVRKSATPPDPAALATGVDHLDLTADAR